MLRYSRNCHRPTRYFGFLVLAAAVMVVVVVAAAAAAFGRIGGLVVGKMLFELREQLFVLLFLRSKPDKLM